MAGCTIIESGNYMGVKVYYCQVRTSPLRLVYSAQGNISGRSDRVKEIFVFINAFLMLILWY